MIKGLTLFVGHFDEEFQDFRRLHIQGKRYKIILNIPKHKK